MAPPLRIYLDNAAATPLDKRVYDAMEPYWFAGSANAGALHADGLFAHGGIERARESVARSVRALPDEIIFNSGGTEGNNSAIQGVVHAARKQGTAFGDMHLITTEIEHRSVLETVRAFEECGVGATYLPVSDEGFVDADALAQALTRDTLLVSIGYVNNEIGTIQPMAEIGWIVRRARERFGSHTLVHTDASQAPAWVPCHVTELGVDLMTLDAQKIFGPKGVGCLYRRRGTSIAPLMYGGGQEFGLRSGTPPTPLVVGFATALALVEEERAAYLPHVSALRDRFVGAVREACPDALYNGPAGVLRLANNANLSFPGLDGEQIVIELDVRGIAASTRSACQKSAEPGSYVVAALGKGAVCAESAVRFSLSRYTTTEEMDRAAEVVIEVVEWLTETRG